MWAIFTVQPALVVSAVTSTETESEAGGRPGLRQDVRAGHREAGRRATRRAAPPGVVIAWLARRSAMPRCRQVDEDPGRRRGHRAAARLSRSPLQVASARVVVAIGHPPGQRVIGRVGPSSHRRPVPSAWGRAGAGAERWRRAGPMAARARRYEAGGPSPGRVTHTARRAGPRSCRHVPPCRHATRRAPSLAPRRAPRDGRDPRPARRVARRSRERCRRDRPVDDRPGRAGDGRPAEPGPDGRRARPRPDRRAADGDRPGPLGRHGDEALLQPHPARRPERLRHPDRPAHRLVRRRRDHRLEQLPRPRALDGERELAVDELARPQGDRPLDDAQLRRRRAGDRRLDRQEALDGRVHQGPRPDRRPLDDEQADGHARRDRARRRGSRSAGPARTSASRS